MANLDHKQSYLEFKEQVLKGLTANFPVKGKDRTLELESLDVHDQAMAADDIKSQHDAKVNGESWAADVFGNMVMRDNVTGKVLERKKVRLAEIPVTTRRHSYLVHGTEYQVSNQWQLKPGAYTRRRNTGDLETSFNIPNKRSFDIVFQPEKKSFVIDRGSSEAIPVYPILKALGVDDDTLKKHWGSEVFEASRVPVGGKKISALARFYKADKGVLPATEADAEKYVVDTLHASKLRPDATKITLGKAFETVNGEALTLATAKMINVHKGAPEDDRDSLVFKDLRNVGDFAYDKLTHYTTSNVVKSKVGRQLNTGKSIRQALKFGTFNVPLNKVFTENMAAVTADQTNPVEMISTAMQTTLMGPGGIQSHNVKLDNAKLINPSHMGFLDPAATPESESTGIILKLPIGVSRKGKEPQVALYNLRTNKTEMVSPHTFSTSNVVLPDQVRWEGGKPVPISKTVKVAEAGNELTTMKFADAHYVMKHPSQLFSVSANLIPFLSSNSGGRAQYATSHIEQAVALKYREAPLVQVATGRTLPGNNTFEELMGSTAGHISPVAGKVVKVTKDHVYIENKDGAHSVALYNNFPLNDPKSSLHSESLVAVGDHVKAGQAVADNNYTKSGALAIGTNLRVAYLPMRGYNFDDGVVLSESAAKKFSSVHMYKPSVKVEHNVVTDPRKFKNQHPASFTRDQYGLLDDEGTVKVGTKVTKGDPLVLATRPYNLKDRMGVGAIQRHIAGAHTDMSVKWESDHAGEVVGVNKRKDGTVTVHVRTVEPMQIGDKLSGRAGNKGIVAKILPDSEMPHTADGKHIEVALNPDGVPGRINVGQILETVTAKIALKTGKPYVVENFMSSTDMLSKVKADLAKHGLTDTEVLHDPSTGVTLGKALVGHQYLLKLSQQIDKKTSARSGVNIAGTANESYDLNLMPVGGGKTGAQSMGNMGMYALLAHGATANIREMQTWKSEGADPSAEGKKWPSQHEAVWRAIQQGDPLPTPKSTFAFQKFTDMLRASGINVEKKGHHFFLAPLTNAQILKMAPSELPNPSALTYSKLDKNGAPVPRPGGLFDEAHTGGHSGKKWSRFELAEPLPNPVFEKAIQSLTGINSSKFESLVASEHAIDKDTHAQVPLGTKGSVTGGVAIAHVLGKLDTKKELAKAEKILDGIPAPKNMSFGANTEKLDAALKRVKYLRALDRLNMQPADAYILKNVPIIPPAMRPASVLPDGSVRWADLNNLYSKMAGINTEMKNSTFKHDLSDHDKKEQRAAVYDGLRALMGVGMTYESRKGKDKDKGILLQIHGSAPKDGFFQDTLLSRRQDLTLRSTIVPEPSMGMDQLGLPAEKSVTLFRPFIAKKLVDTGVVPHALEAHKLLGAKEAYKNPLVLKALDSVMLERPVLLKRDPVLHKHGVLGFNAFRVAGKAIQVHPLVTGGYNADFDGDAMSVYVPISTEAVHEARQMLPSKNMYNEATGGLMNVPGRDAAMGLYKLSKIVGDKGKSFANPAEAMIHAESGKIGVQELVHVSGIGKTTVGRIIISTALPEALRENMLKDPNATLNKANASTLYKAIAANHNSEFSESVNKLKDLGFDTSHGAVKIPRPASSAGAIVHAEDPKSSRYIPTGVHSFSLDDFDADRASRDPIVKATQHRVDVINATTLSKAVKNERAIEEWSKATDAMGEAHKKVLKSQPNNIHEMTNTYSKPSWVQYRQIKLSPMLMQDSAGKVVPLPVTKSYAEGLDVAGYWTQMHGARMGSVKKVQETQEPGYMTKRLVNTTLDLVITGHDCGTTRGIALPISSKNVYDRELNSDLKIKSHTFAKGTLLTPTVVTQIRALDKDALVAVRSSLKCEHGKGLCQKCAGIAPDGKHYELGTNLGLIAGQALGERALQLTLKVFHSGGVATGGSKAIGMVDRVNQLLNLPARIPYEAQLALHTGKIESIDKGKLGSTVTINGVGHFVPLDKAGRQLVSPLDGLNPKKWGTYKVGDHVKAGDYLSDPNRTTINPHALYKATGNMELVQNHLVNELHSVYADEGVRRQHMETVVKAMGNATRIIDPGGATHLLKGDYHAASALRQLNKELVASGKAPVHHAPILKGIDVMPLHVQEDWMAKMNFENLRATVREAASLNASSNVHGLHPAPAMAFGAEIGLSAKDKLRYPHLANVPGYHY